jgi:hypothetical protein
VWAVTYLRPYLEGIDFTVRTDHHALRWVMNLSDAQGRLARRRLRLSEFTFKVEYNPGSAHHAADALSRLPHQAVPPEPIEEEIPVCSVSAQANRTSVTRDNPCAFEESSPSPIEEVPLIPMSEVFDHQCLDPTARRVREQWFVTPRGTLTGMVYSSSICLPVRSLSTFPCPFLSRARSYNPAERPPIPLNLTWRLRYPSP